MKVLMMNRPRESWVGGDMVQMDATMRELAARGHEVKFSDVCDPALFRWADIVHLWNASMDWTFFQWAEAHGCGCKVVCSTIYHDIDRFLSFKSQQRMLNGLDAIICLCDGEVDRIKIRHNIDADKVHIIPNGIEEFFFADSGGAPLDFALTVGRIEEFKGQRYVAEVCRDMRYQYICIGDGDKEEVELLKSLGAVVIPSLPREDLVQYYARCFAYVLASQNEIFPLTVLEALAQRKKIILTEESCWFPEGSISCKHGDKISIRNAFNQLQYAKPLDVGGMKWPEVARQIEEVYQCVLQ